MNLTQEQLIQLIGGKELDLFALRTQVQQLQQALQEKDDEIKSLKEQLKEMEK